MEKAGLDLGIMLTQSLYIANEYVCLAVRSTCTVTVTKYFQLVVYKGYSYLYYSFSKQW